MQSRQKREAAKKRAAVAATGINAGGSREELLAVPDGSTGDLVAGLVEGDELDLLLPDGEDYEGKVEEDEREGEEEGGEDYR